MRDLVEYLPPHLAADDENRSIQDALTRLMAKYEAAWDDMLLQLHPETAGWGLELWEKAYGILGGSGLAVERRREVVIARIRSARTATVEAVRLLAESFSGGQVEVTEFNSEYRFEVKLVGVLGTPVWYDAFRDAIRAFAPAHLLISYSRRYLTVAEVEAMPVAELNATPLDYFVGGI